MIVDQDMMHCFELVAKDLCEAHAADRMLTDMSMREDRLAEFDRSEARLQFIAGSLALRTALAVNRTLRGASNDKASFARLLKLAKAPTTTLIYQSSRSVLTNCGTGQPPASYTNAETASWPILWLESLALAAG